MTNRPIHCILPLVIPSTLAFAAMFGCAWPTFAQPTLSSLGSPPAMPAAWLSTSSDLMPQPDPTSHRPLPIPKGAPLTLKDAITIALKYHPLAAQAAAESAAAEEQVDEARSYLALT